MCKITGLLGDEIPDAIEREKILREALGKILKIERDAHKTKPLMMTMIGQMVDIAEVALLRADGRYETNTEMDHGLPPVDRRMIFDVEKAD